MIINSRKVVMIGCGFVGSSSAFALMQSGLFSEMVLIDADQNRAEGEAMDISHGMSFASPMKIYAGSYDDISDAAIIVITAGANQKPDETRLNLIRKNAGIMKSIIGEIKKRDFGGILLIVSNPVDILTYIALKESGYPANRVIGSGTVLDSSRLRTCLADHAGLNIKNIHAYVFGEHGDSSMIPWSLSSIAGMKFDEYCTSVEDLGDKDAIEQEVRDGGAEVIKCKGATYYAIALSVSQITEAILRDTKAVLTVSTLQDGTHYGVKDVCLSLPCVLGANGVEREITPPMTDDEIARFQKSGEALRSVIDQMAL